MALSHLLQPKLNLPIFRLSLSTATTRFFTSKRSNGDIDNPPPSKKEAAAQGTGITPVVEHIKQTLEGKTGFFSKATSVLGLVARYVGSTNSERPSVPFTGHKDHLTETKAENEGRKAELALSDDQIVRCDGVEKSSQSKSSPKVSALEIDKDNQPETTAENEGRKAESALSDCQNVSCEGVETSLQSNESAPEIDKPINSKGLSDLFTEHKDKQTETTAENEGRKAEAELSDYQNVRCETVERSLHSYTNPKVLGRKSASDESAMEIDEVNTSNANMQRSENDMLNLLDFLDRTSSVDDKKTSNSDNKNVDLKELKTCFKVPTINKDQKQRKDACPTTTESVENRVLVRFLDSNSTEFQIRECFNGCGEISKIEVLSAQGPLFKAASINFKAKEGFEKALRKSGSLISSGAIIVESATVMENKTVKIPIPGLLGDLDIPSALIKNPTRTIKIEKLSKGISSHNITEALAFCKSNISGYFLGSSHSVAYVEFESEIGKERALAKQSISVLGRQLVMLRIDCPRTTVVRISSKGSLNQKNLVSVCKSLGDVKVSKIRSPNMLDVQFKHAEWPNMVKILNGLNGRMVEGQRLQAEPAPVFPPEVLLSLWHHKEERKCLGAAAKVLLNKLSEFTSDTSELVFLENDFFCKI